MRKKVICKECKVEKEHFGLQMCSPCLRKTKRQTKPSFYLGTQYSEIKRRCTHPNLKKRYYQGRKFCSKQEYIDKFILRRV